MSITSIPSPYHFVPMAEKVHYPEWQNINQDSPIENGLSGAIEYQLTAHSPILVGENTVKDESGGIVNFFKTPDNTYAIPGTSLKGMVRNWLEIATHSRMSIINDTWLSYRDLTNRVEYSDLLTEEMGNKTFRARTAAGWMRFESGEWKLYPADSWRVENSDIQKAFNLRINGKESEKIYKKLNGIQGVTFSGEKETTHPHSNGNTLVYAKARNIAPSDTPDGYLIVTGQGSSNKHMNFIFKAPQNEPKAFESESVLKGFLDINLDREDFKYLKNLKHKHGIPVFYLEDRGCVTQMGMAQMFRFPYKYSVGQLRHNSHLDETETRKDFAELLFGSLEDDTESRKGRVSFSLAKCQQNNIQPLTLKPTVLGGPKNSFYPAYIDQSNAKNAYKTYNQNEAKLAGFKRYVIRKAFSENELLDPPTIKGNTNFNVATQLRPLPEDTSFKGKIRFHNLKPIELGALLFALNIDTNEDDQYHNLGMGKAMGLGKIKFSKLSVKLALKNLNSEINDYLEEFRDYARTSIKSNVTIIQLQMLQSEVTFDPAHIKYPTFKPNQFVEILNSEGQAKLINLNEKANLKQKRDAENRQKEAIKEAQLSKHKELTSDPAYQSLLKEHFGDENGKYEVSKAMFQQLNDEPQLWQNLHSGDQHQLATFLKNAPYYKTYREKQKKQAKKKKELNPNFTVLEALFS